ncbi:MULTISPECIES: hypothetical protein [Acinetobacter]|nr:MULTISPECIES: hypothetical protein [Acinetobacter]MDF0626898.1 hypothetical protein [Acinetobacter nosocomialis]
MKILPVIFLALVLILILTGCIKEAEAKSSTAGAKVSFKRSLISKKTNVSQSPSTKPSYVNEKAKQVRKSKSIFSGPEYVYYPLGDCKRWVTFNFNGYRCIDRDL